MMAASRLHVFQERLVKGISRVTEIHELEKSRNPFVYA